MGEKQSDYFKLNVLPDNPDLQDHSKAVGLGRFPKWLHRKMPQTNALWETQNILDKRRLATVCEEAKCPNLLECFSKKIATFLVMGKVCTRSCGFCDIDFNEHPKPLSLDEPDRIAASVSTLRLKHVVITMVTRDDLEDGGAWHLVKIIQSIKKANSNVTIEILTSDFQANPHSFDVLLKANFEIFNHNIETVRSLTPRVRHKATYGRTLSVLKLMHQKAPGIRIKSGFMLGLGEEEHEVKETIDDLYQAGCEVITIGQYLQPNRRKLRVKAFIHPDQFACYAAYGHSIGVKQMYCGPFVRSSYNAATLYTHSTKDPHTK